MNKIKIFIIIIIALLIIGSSGLYYSLDILKKGKSSFWSQDNYFHEKLKLMVPQNIIDFIKETIIYAYTNKVEFKNHNPY